MIIQILKLIRVKQWSKNLLVFAGVFFSGAVFTNTFTDALLVFITFCLASSTVYIINDIKDKENDKKHPVKKNRPLAAGKISVAQAAAIAILFIVLLIFLCYFISSIAKIIIAGYILFNILYTYVLKHLAIYDIFSIAIGFLLRILAGTSGLGIENSAWLIITAGALVIFLATTKRLQELQQTQASHRKVLALYTKEYLHTTQLISATACLIFYTLYVLDKSSSAWYLLSILFVAIGFFRFLFLVQTKGVLDEPITAFYKDRELQIIVVIWVALLFLGIYILI